MKTLSFAVALLAVLWGLTGHFMGVNIIGNAMVWMYVAAGAVLVAVLTPSRA